jgi:hypothetical protein
MTKPALPISSWRTPLAPTVFSALVITALIVPVSFVVFFGLLPPFWLGASRGLLAETQYAYDITYAVVWNWAFDFMYRYLPILPADWRASEWETTLQTDMIWNPFLLRFYATIGAAAWVVVILAIRQYLRTERVQGFQYVSGPRLWEERTATARARAAIAAEERPSDKGLQLAPGLKLSIKRELASFAILGGQGSGKTTVLKFLFAQLCVRKKTKLVVLDQKGELTSQWPSGSVIFFAPHDQRSHVWNIGADVVNEMDAQEFAATMIPAEGSEAVWPQGARQIAEAVVIALQRRHGKNWGFSELLAAFESSPVELRDMVKSVRPDVLAFLSLDERGEFTRTSIGYMTNLQATMTPLLRPLALSWGMAPKEKRISLKSWLHDKGPKAQTLILQNNTDYPTVSAGWMRQVIQRLVRFTGSSAFPEFEDSGQRVWFVLDEFPQLGRMPDLLRIPATHRSKGVTLLLTAQSISQIYSTYSKDQADTLLNLMQTKIILNPGQGSDIVERINRWIGKLRWRDPVESVVTTPGPGKPIPEHESDLITPAYMATLGQGRTNIYGLILGIGPDAYRMRWPLQKWPRQRPPVRLANWANAE